MSQSTTYGKRLLPTVLDQLAISKPDQPCIGAPLDVNNLSNGYTNYTFAELANAVNIFASQLEHDIGKSSSFETVAYIGPNDIRYIVVVLAAIKTGHVALLISPRNSDQAQINLFEQTRCKSLITDDVKGEAMKRLASNYPARMVPIQSVEELLRAPSVENYPYNRSFEQARFDPLVILHTSGSTGFPKPITVKQGNLSIIDAYHDLPDYQGNPNWVNGMAESESLFLPMPLFHAAGLSMTLSRTIFAEHLIALPPAGKPLDITTVQKCMEVAHVDSAFLAPSMLEEMSNDADMVEFLASMKYIGTGAGNIAHSVGDSLTKKGVKIRNVIGTTEHNPYPEFFQDPQYWDYFLFQDEASGFDWRHVEDDIYELWIVRQHDDDPGLQACFYTFPDLKEYNTKDLFKKHATRPGNWQYFGRSDNIIVLSNGEKFNPITLEHALTGLPEVRGALVVGTDRFQPALLIEPAVYPAAVDEERSLLERLWPHVDKINKSSPAHARIARPFVALIPRSDAFPRSSKGSIQRGLAERGLKDFIDNLFETAYDGQETDHTLDWSSEQALTDSVREIISSQLENLPVEPHTDFFAIGMDSMQILTTSRALNRLLKDEKTIKVTPKELYSNPTSALTAHYLWAQTQGTADGVSDEDQVGEMVKRYTSSLPSADSLTRAPLPASQNLTIVLTGSTGSIGSYILELLNKHPSVSKVIALNRGGDIEARQQQSSSSRGLSTTYAKTIFLSADLSKQSLGLSESAYQEILDHADVILHNSWRVDFNLSLSSFEPHVIGTRNLIDVSLLGQKRARIVFVTTIAEAAGYESSEAQNIVPEESLGEHTMPAIAGYGASKLVVSRMLDVAAKQSGVPMAIVRVGQVAGPVDQLKGSWNRWEWFPSIVASSLELGILPGTLGETAALDSLLWVPVEREAELLVEVALGGNTGIFNGVNPRAGSYKTEVLPVLQAALGKKKEMKVVSWTEWVHALELSEPGTQTPEQVERNPGVKLLDFYKSMDSAGEGGVNGLQWSTERAQDVSKTWRELEPVHSEWVERWLRQWNF